MQTMILVIKLYDYLATPKVIMLTQSFVWYALPFVISYQHEILSKASFNYDKADFN